jgi:hypothetical protein
MRTAFIGRPKRPRFWASVSSFRQSTRRSKRDSIASAALVHHRQLNQTFGRHDICRRKSRERYAFLWISFSFAPCPLVAKLISFRFTPFTDVPASPSASSTFGSTLGCTLGSSFRASPHHALAASPSTIIAAKRRPAPPESDNPFAVPKGDSIFMCQERDRLRQIEVCFATARLNIHGFSMNDSTVGLLSSAMCRRRGDTKRRTCGAERKCRHRIRPSTFECTLIVCSPLEFYR